MSVLCATKIRISVICAFRSHTTIFFKRGLSERRHLETAGKTNFYSWLLFLRKGYNYAEHLALHAFLGGFRSVFFLLIFTPLVIFYREHYNQVLLLYFSLWTVYVAWANIQLMEKPHWLTVLKTVLIVVFTQATISVFIFLIAWLYFRG